MSDKSNSGGTPQRRARLSLFGRAAQPAVPARRPPAPEPPQKRSGGSLFSRFSGFLSFAMVALILGLAGFAWVTLQARKAGPLAADKIVILTRDDNDGSLGEQLERAGVIDNALWFSSFSILDGSSRSLKRGEYEFKAGSSFKQVEELLASGKVVLHSLTIPEGLTSEQVAQRLRESDFLSGDLKDAPREGSILPDTYKAPRDFPRAKILAKMAEDQAKVVAEIWQKRAPDLPIKSPGELVTLASIVEKETGKAEERPHVAGVFINRLQRRIKLQSDPTIVYGLVFGKGTLGHSITKAELEQPTPYNTYVIEGLPPGPIANPGRAAMEAVANPSRTKDIFFVADGTGGHAFAETLDQHLKNVARWRQLQQDSKDRVAPDVAPTPAPQTHGEANPVDPTAFGALAPTQPRQAPRLGDMRSLVEIAGGHVSGVDDGASGDGFTARSPLSPAALADLKTRLAKYASANAVADAPPGKLARLASASPTGAKPRGFDASEGTALDPLLNKSYDLNSAKTVPILK